MKYILILFVLFYTNISISQNLLYNILPINDKSEVVFEGIDSVNNVSKERLYSISKSWIFETFNSGKDVLQLDDKENNIISGNGIITNYWDRNVVLGKTKMTISFKFKIETKDNRY